MLKFIFLLLEQRLKALPELREVDWFNNQYDPNEDQEVIYAAPAVYLEFMAIPTKSEKKGIQDAIVTFTTHIVTELFQDNNGRFASAALEHFDIVNSVYAHLLGYSGLISDLAGQEALKDTPADYQLFNSITRTMIETDHERAPLMVSKLTFTMTAKDFSAQKAYSTIQVPIRITPSISQTL